MRLALRCKFSLRASSKVIRSVSGTCGHWIATCAVPWHSLQFGPISESVEIWCDDNVVVYGGSMELCGYGVEVFLRCQGIGK